MKHVFTRGWMRRDDGDHARPLLGGYPNGELRIYQTKRTAREPSHVRYPAYNFETFRAGQARKPPRRQKYLEHYMPDLAQNALAKRWSAYSTKPAFDTYEAFEALERGRSRARSNARETRIRQRMADRK